VDNYDWVIYSDGTYSRRRPTTDPSNHEADGTYSLHLSHSNAPERHLPLPAKFRCGCQPVTWCTTAIAAETKATTSAVILEGESCPHHSTIAVRRELVDNHSVSPFRSLTDSAVESLIVSTAAIAHSGTNEAGALSIGELLDLEMAEMLARCVASLELASYRSVTQADSEAIEHAIDAMTDLSTARCILASVKLQMADRKIGPLTGRALQSALDRLELAASTISSIQSVRLEVLAHKISEFERKQTQRAARRESMIRHQEQRVTRIATYTLFPMLILALAGANVLPNFDYGEWEFSGPVALTVTVALAVLSAFIGNRLIINNSKDDPGDNE